MPLPPAAPAPPRVPANELYDLARSSASAMMHGKSEESLEQAKRIREAASDERIVEEKDTEALRPILGLTLARLGRWDEIMEDSPPPSHARYATAMWHFTRGAAFAAADRLVETEAEYNVLRNMIREPQLGAQRFSDGTAAIDALAIAERVLSAEIARMGEMGEEEIDALTQAGRVQDAAPQTAVPPVYPWPRLQLAAALLRSGNAQDAEFALREQLVRTPDDGWALWGLAMSLRAQGKTREAAGADKDFHAAWIGADISPDILYR